MEAIQLRSNNFLMGAAVGLATGATIYWMTSTRAGGKAARNLRKKADVAAKSIGDMVDNIQQSIR